MDTPEPHLTAAESSVSGPNEALTAVSKKFKVNPKLIYVAIAVVAVLLAGAAYYAYSQGSLTGITPSTSSSTSTSPTISSDISSLNDTVTQVQNDFTDVDGISSDIDSIDTTSDQTPQL